MLARFAPPGVVINEDLQILQFRGDVSPFLQPASGAASLQFLKMVRKDLVNDLRVAIDHARRISTPTVCKDLRVNSDELRSKVLNVELIPIDPASGNGRLLIVLFEVVPREPDAAEASVPAEGTAVSSDLEKLTAELAAARQHLQFMIDERQASEEELRSANEEILSSNEELQSTNEELETSQEELQSANEELTTVNDELQHRNAELSRLGNDLSNILTSVNIPIVMLGSDLTVRHFTPLAGRVLNLRAADIDRPITEIKSNVEIPDLEKLLQGVVEDLTPREIEIQDKNGAWFSLRIRPYRTEDNKIDGAVMVFYDVDRLKRSLHEVEQARDFRRRLWRPLPSRF